MIEGLHEIKSIVDGCIKQDRKAQELLYRSFYGVMMNICLRYTKNDMDALEVLNSGFYKVFKNIHNYDSKKGALYTWISTIIIRTCLDMIDKKGRLKNIQHIYGSDIEPAIEPEILSRFSVDELLQILQKLPVINRAVFNLFVCEGYSHREIGELLKIKENTSKWHLREARKMMQQLLTEQKANE